MNKTYDVIILGSGPAGLTAAIYSTRAALKTLIIAGERWGGQLQLTTLVENFPGFPEGIQGPELMMNMRKQAEHHGAEIIDVNFAHGDFTKSPFSVEADGKTYKAKAVIIATGTDTKWLGIPGEKEKIGRGVSTCAPCDAAFFREKDVIVAGGGDTAMEEAIVLTRFAKSVTIVHRRDEFRASAAMLQKAKANPKIHFLLNAELVEIIGALKVEKVTLRIRPSDKNFLTAAKELHLTVVEKDKESILAQMPIDGVFVAIGHTPNTKVFNGIEIDERGYITVYEHTKTNREGVFVAGDVHDNQYQQAITAAGFGCAAALEAERWLEQYK